MVTEDDTAENNQTTARDYSMSPALLASLVAVPIVALAIIIGLAMKFTPEKSVPTPPLRSIAAPDARSAECKKFLARIPKNISDDIEIRCGVTNPSNLKLESSTVQINSVQWFQDENQKSTGTLWYAIDHRPLIAIWLPVNSGNAPITTISEIIDATLSSSPIVLSSN